ncbi:MAG: GNAT family N-acetyltransferase [Nocardioides sp.]
MWRHLTPADLDNWHALVDDVQDHDRLNERLTRVDLEAFLGRPGVETDTWLYVVDGGALAWGRNVRRETADGTSTVFLNGGVAPDSRGRGIGRELLTRQVTRAQEMTSDRIGTFVEQHLTGRRVLFEQAGFVPVRWSSELRRPLPPERASAVLLPDGLELRPWRTTAGASVLTAFNTAFDGQWGTPRYTTGSWQERIEGDEAFRADLSAVVVDTHAAGDVVGFVVNAEYVEDWPAFGYSEGYTEYVGVVPSHRGRGIATALLELTADRFHELGHTFATLNVDADNPTGAGALYRSVGYREHHTTTFHSMNGAR